MSAVGSASDRRQAFSARTVLALVAVGLVSFAGLAVLSAYAPELRGATDPGAHALSASAVGFKGATIMLKAEGAPVVISRAVPHGADGGDTLVVLTPPMQASAQDLGAFAQQAAVLIVLPKWFAMRQPLHLDWVDKAGVLENSSHATAVLKAFAPATEIGHRQGVATPTVHGVAGGDMAGAFLRLFAVDGWQTIGGDGWIPVLVDERGEAILARSKSHPNVLVLSEPDLLNNQGLAHLDNARAGIGILNALRAGRGLRFDVTLNGYTRGRGIGRMMLQPPWLAATLCGVAAALLMGLHGLARFGPTLARGRAIALGKRALVDNSAGLVRMAGREAELAPAYAVLTKALVAKVAGGGERTVAGRDPEGWLGDLARHRGAADPADLTAQAERAKTRDDLLAIGRSLYNWRLEITRERR